MPLPDFPSVTDDILRAIAARHGLKSTRFPLWPQVGTFNAIYGFDADNLILRVPRNHPRFILAARNEAIAVPLAIAAGVRTPALAVYDDYALDPAGALQPLRACARHEPRAYAARSRGGLARLVRTRPRSRAPSRRRLARWSCRRHRALRDEDGPPPAARHHRNRGLLHRDRGRLARALARPPRAGSPSRTAPRRFLHGDTQSANLIVDPGTLTYTAVIDWGSCLWGDTALDFAGIPLRAVPALLAGYRETAAVMTTTPSKPASSGTISRSAFTSSVEPQSRTCRGANAR